MVRTIRKKSRLLDRITVDFFGILRFNYLHQEEEDEEVSGTPWFPHSILATTFYEL